MKYRATSYGGFYRHETDDETEAVLAAERFVVATTLPATVWEDGVEVLRVFGPADYRIIEWQERELAIVQRYGLVGR